MKKLKLIKFKKQEREALVEQIMDYWFNYADPADMVEEIRSIHSHGLHKDFVPYLERTDSDLCYEMFKTWDTDYASMFELFEMVMETESRAKRVTK